MALHHLAHGLLRPARIGAREEIGNLLGIRVGRGNGLLERGLVIDLGGPDDLDGRRDVLLE